MNDLIGQKFGRLTVIKYCGNNKWRDSLWLCKCDCGNEKIISRRSLIIGDTKSCGCLRREKNRLNPLKHGHARSYKESKIYRAWKNMKRRCANSNFKQYKDYGGRNIKVCKRWLKFKNFLKDIGEIPKGLTLDRINNDGDYQPDNWRLITQYEQNRNQRSNILVLLNEKYIILKDYCKIKDLNYGAISQRIRRGYSIEEALATPIRKRKQRRELNEN